MHTSDTEPLKPAAGGINCILAEQPVSHSADITTKGGATRAALNRLMADVGAAVMALAMEEPRGTLEIQLTCQRQDNDKAGISTHQWRVDVWKARQRQFLRVPVRRRGELNLSAADTLSAHGIVPLREGQRLGEFNCPHCNLAACVPPVTEHKLPRTVTLNCSRCTLPFHVQLVNVKGE